MIERGKRETAGVTAEGQRLRLGSALSMFCCDAATVAYLCTGIHGQR